MREIKFRVWNKDAQSFVLNGKNEAVSFNLILWACYASMNALENINHLTVEQFTGLLDKFGKEIFEGDIVKTPIWAEDNESADSFGLRVVSYNSNYAAFLLGEHALMKDFIEDVEIIGNVHQNMDLLK